jgi:hypothetical protein
MCKNFQDQLKFILLYKCFFSQTWTRILQVRIYVILKIDLIRTEFTNLYFSSILTWQFSRTRFLKWCYLAKASSRGRFHQTCFAKRKVTGAVRSAKNRRSISPIFSASKFALDVSLNSPFAKFARKCWWNRPQKAIQRKNFHNKDT